MRPISAAGVVVICSTPTTSTMRAAPAAIAFEALMHGGRAGGAGILDPRRALEAQIGRSLQHQRGGEILRREAGVEVAEQDLVDVAGRDAGIGERFGRHLDDQAFDGFAVKLAERRMRPADDAGGHDRSLRRIFGRLFLGLMRFVAGLRNV